MIKEKEIAEIFGQTYKNISVKKKDLPKQYEIIRLGAICKKYNIKEEDLKKLINEDLQKAFKILEICKEK